MTAMTAAELRAKVEGLREDGGEYMTDDGMRVRAWNRAITRVSDILPESGVFVTEADLTRALRETGSYSRRPIDQWAAAILRELTR
jgi:hypothetical protein